MRKSLTKQTKIFLWYSFGRKFEQLRNAKNPYQDINDRSNSIFIHIPKTGGISVEKALYQEKVGHKPLHLFQYYNANKFEKYFKFTFVRNPWDRLVSSYIFLKQGGRNKIDAEFSIKFLSQFDTFEEFVEGISNERTKKTALNWLHFCPQVDFIKDYRGSINLNYIGHFETLEKDFNIIAKKLNIDALLPHENKSTRKKDYQLYYSSETAQIVSRIYRDDIEKFNYKFEKL